MTVEVKNIESNSKTDASLTHEQLIKSGLDIKLSMINKYDEIIWKVRSGYLVILYGALTLFIGRELPKLDELARSRTTSLSIFFLILGLSLSAFLVDFGYLRKKLRVIVIRNMLMEVAYDPSCKFKEKLNILLYIASETPLQTHFRAAETKYKSKLKWNLIWILLPIYSTTPALALLIYLIHQMMVET